MTLKMISRNRPRQVILPKGWLQLFAGENEPPPDPLAAVREKLAALKGKEGLDSDLLDLLGDVVELISKAPAAAVSNEPPLPEIPALPPLPEPGPKDEQKPKSWLLRVIG